VPIYNAENYLAKCIESLIHQNYRALQIILVDDGSTDNSLTIAHQYAAQDTRIEVYTQTHQGQSVARNNGLQYASGEWIAFVDADDYLDTDCYAQLMQHIAHNDCVQMGYRRMSTDGKIIEEKCPRYFYQFTSPCMRLYRRDLFTKHQLTFPEGMIYEDVIFSLDFWATNPTFISIPYTGYNYTFNPLSTTAKRNRTREKELFEVLNAKLRHAHSFKLWCITLLTIIRLKLHFMRYE
jgi:glycosyltransferase involved in cell wall biosynthesis